ncbi:MAG: helix-turn-helix domain-containing protein [Brachymonas sp.]|nr:helix-turn-helix domain-containing protein [Brachymonas sp.]
MVAVCKPSRPSKPASKAQVKRNTAKRGPGRPSSYREHYADQAYKLTLLGATDAQLGNFFEVSEQTINTWKKVYPAFLESIKRGKDVADARVAEALFKRATGYSHPDTHISNYQGEVTITPIEKHYPPDPASMIFWLKNRQPESWRDRVEADINVGDIGELAGVYDDAMRRAHERQQAILDERGLLDGDGGRKV